jgi:hypothetical protein
MVEARKYPLFCMPSNVRQHSPRLAQIWMIGAAADAWS